MLPLSWTQMLLSVGEAVGFLHLSSFHVHSSHLEILFKFRLISNKLPTGASAGAASPQSE